MVVLPASPGQAERGERAAQTSALRHERHVRQPADGRAKAYAETIDGEHERLREVDERLKQPSGPVDRRLGLLADLAQVQARRKRSPIPGDDGHPNRRIIRRSEQPFGQRIEQRPTKCVEGFGSVQGEDTDKSFVMGLQHG